MKVLGVGNSFTINVNRFIEDICREGGKMDLRVTVASIGGCSLAEHVRLAEIHEKDPEAREGRPYPITEDGATVYKSLKQLLQAEDWGAVTIQQKSTISADISTYRPHAEELCKYIRRYEPDVEIIVHKTWAYRADDKIFKNGYTQEEMYRRLSHAYRTIAGELGDLRVIPVGDAFQMARSRPDFKLKVDAAFDPEKVVYPQVPSQEHSLCLGWRWYTPEGGQPSFGLDAHHANYAGEYLGGLVWYEFFTGESAELVTFKPEELSEAEAKILRSVAHLAVCGQ